MTSAGVKMKIHSRLLRASKKCSRRGLYEFLRAECDALPNDIQVLNVGSGGAVEELLAIQAKIKNWTCVSLDVDPKRMPNIVGSIERYDAASDSYGAVFLVEVLEHVEQPSLAIDNILRMLKPQGRLVMSTPFLFPVHDAPSDYYRFTAHGLRLLLRKFSDVTVIARNGYFESINVLAMRILVSTRGSTFVGLATAFFSIYFLKNVALRVDRWLNLELGTTGYTTSAVKPERGAVT